MKIILIFAIIFLFILALFFSCKFTKNKNPEPEKLYETDINDEKIYLTTTTESEKRISEILPAEGSENVSSILKTPAYINQKNVKNEYLPNENLEWVVNVTLENNTIIPTEKINKIFNTNWRKKYGGLIIYGFDNEKKEWTYISASDSPKSVSNLKFAWSYFNSWEENDINTNYKIFQQRIESIKSNLSKYNIKKISSTLSPEEAKKKHDEIQNIYNKFNREVILILKADSNNLFEGKELWDVMLSLGLKWGDMDLFHWENENTPGDDFYFSVWTSTNPGYFIPEYIAKGNYYVNDLIFGFSLPRTYKPQQIYKSMAEAIKYCKKRLGGEILNYDGNTPDYDLILSEIKTIENNLIKIGFEPGSDNALMLF